MENKTAKVKKKHKGLKVLLTLLAIIALIIGIRFLGINYVQTQLEERVGCPFTFNNETNNQQYITDNFTVSMSFPNKKGRENKVTWNSSKKNVISINDEGIATVTRGETNQVVTLTETYNFLLFHAKKDYTCVVVTDNTQTYNEDQIVSIDSVKEGTYEDKMQIVVSSDGRITSMYGNFGSVTVYNEKDAYAFIEAYRKTLGFPDEYSFEVEKISNSPILSTYSLGVYYDGIKIKDDTVILCVGTADAAPVKITCNVSDCLIASENIQLDESVYEQIILSKYEGIDGITYEDFGSVIIDNAYCENLCLSYADDCSWHIYINKKDLTIVREDFGISKLTGEKTTITGKTEDNKTVKVEGTYLNDYYYLYDQTRNILVYDNMGYLPAMAPTDVYSASNDFEDRYPVGIEALKYIGAAYDYYYNNFGISSYDNRGSMINVYYNVDYPDFLAEKIKFFNMNYNAKWVRNYHIFLIGLCEKYKHTLAVDPTILVHEYTHSIIDMTFNYDLYDGIFSVGIDEGYADVMACLAVNPEHWYIGKSIFKEGAVLQDYNGGYICDGTELIYLRNLESFENTELGAFFEGTPPKYYDVEGFESLDCHLQSVLIGHLGYEMYHSGLWTSDELTKIWFQSLVLGYTKDSTFVDVRRNLIQALDQLGYAKSFKDFVAYQCDLMHIYDSDYMITTPEYASSDEATSDGSRIFTTANGSVDDDPILDDTHMNRYLIFYSPLATFAGHGKVFIFENTENRYGAYTDEKIGQMIEEKLNEGSSLHKLSTTGKKFYNALGALQGGDDTLSSVSDHISVEYRRVPSKHIDFIRKWLGEKETTMKEYIAKTLGIDNEEDSTEFNKYFKLIMEYYIIDSSAYNFYKGL